MIGINLTKIVSKLPPLMTSSILTKYYSEKQLRGMSEKYYKYWIEDYCNEKIQHHKWYAKVFNHQHEGPKPLMKQKI